jgi:hypothetical protein
MTFSVIDVRSRSFLTIRSLLAARYAHKAEIQSRDGSARWTANVGPRTARTAEAAATF